MEKRQREFYELEQVRFQSFGGRENNHHYRLEEVMKSSIRDKAEGTLHEVKGKVKEVAGQITDNPKLAAEGKAEKIAGRVQGKFGQAKKVFGK